MVSASRPVWPKIYSLNHRAIYSIVETFQLKASSYVLAFGDMYMNRESKFTVYVNRGK